jgi:ATP-dependent RNA helicase DDX23/PRP28
MWNHAKGHITETGLQPKFLSKEERAKLAIEKRAQEIKEQREKEERQRKGREVLEAQAAELRRQEDNDRYRGGSSRDSARRV